MPQVALTWSLVRLRVEQAASDGSAHHLPPVRDVQVTEAMNDAWEEWGGAELEPLFVSGAVALIDSAWLIALANKAHGRVARALR